MPPARAIASAVVDSVTVSILAEMIGDRQLDAAAEGCMGG